MFNAANFSGNGNVCSVNRYFQIVSSGKLNYVNTVVGPVRLSKRRSHYINNLLVKEALDIAVDEFDVDLSEFDSRDEGIVDAMNFLYAGDSQYNGDLWPHNSVEQLYYGAVRTHYYQLTGLGSRVANLIGLYRRKMLRTTYCLRPLTFVILVNATVGDGANVFPSRGSISLR